MGDLPRSSRSRIESRIALAMLPIGGAMTVISVVAFVAVLVLAFDTIVQRPRAAVLLLVWCASALVVAVANTVKSIETMSSFNWRAMIPVAALSLAIVATYPGWYM